VSRDAAHGARRAGHRAVADFASLKSVRRHGRGDRNATPAAPCALNNAGTGARQRRETADGFEWSFAVNHLAPFLLTKLLLPTLTKSTPARVVTVASMAPLPSLPFSIFDDLQWQQPQVSNHAGVLGVEAREYPVHARVIAASGGYRCHG